MVEFFDFDSPHIPIQWKPNAVTIDEVRLPANFTPQSIDEYLETDHHYYILMDGRVIQDKPMECSPSPNFSAPAPQDEETIKIAMAGCFDIWDCKPAADPSIPQLAAMESLVVYLMKEYPDISEGRLGLDSGGGSQISLHVIHLFTRLRSDQERNAFLKGDDLKLAERFLKEFEENTYEFPYWKFDADVTDQQRWELRSIIEGYRDGRVGDTAIRSLEQAGFSNRFIQKIAGDDGKKLFRIKARWLAEHAVKRRWRVDDDTETRAKFLTTLTGMGPLPYDLFPYLAEATRDEETQIRSRAAWALGHLEKVTEEVMQTLIQILKEGVYEGYASHISFDYGLRDMTVATIQKIGPPLSIMAKKELAIWYREPEAQEALAAMGPKEAIPALLPFAASESIFGHTPNIYVARIIQPMMPEGTRYVVEGLMDTDPNIKIGASLLLAELEKLDPEAIPFAIPELEKLAEDPDANIRDAAQKALEKLKGDYR